MRIAHIINNLKAGGAQTFLISLAKEQRKLGNEVFVIIADKISDVSFEPILVEKLESSGIKVYFLNRVVGRKISIISCLFNLHRICKAINADIINSHLELTHQIVGIYTWLCKLFFVSKKWVHIITIHNAPEVWGRLTMALNRKVPSIYCSLASLKTTAYRDCLKEAIENGINPPGVDDFEKDVLGKKGISKNDKLVLCVGKLSKQKNYALVAEIAKLYLNTNVKFLVCGMPDNTSKQDISAFDSIKSIQYLGVSSPTEVYSLMAECDCFLNTSLYEGLPITVLEAFFIGIPCVLSPILAHEEIGKPMPYCYVAKSFAKESFKESLDGVFDLNLDKDMVKTERQSKLQNFNISVTAKRYCNFYKQVRE